MVIVLFTVRGGAHESTRSESRIAIDGSAVRVQFTIDLLELPEVDANRDGRASYDELDARIEEVFAAIRQHYALRAPDAPVRSVMARHAIADDHMLRAELEYTFGRAVRELAVESTLDTITSASHVHHVRAEIGGDIFQALLTPASRRVTFLVGGPTIGRIASALAALAGLTALVVFRILQKRPDG